MGTWWAFSVQYMYVLKAMGRDLQTRLKVDGSVPDLLTLIDPRRNNYRNFGSAGVPAELPSSASAFCELFASPAYSPHGRGSRL